MPTQEPDRNPEIHAEFKDPFFAEHYTEIADTFIDTKGAAASLKKLLSPSDTIFEIGVGTGYFSHFLLEDGYTVVGSQLNDPMLDVLQRDHPDLEVLSNEPIEAYEFDRQYDAIISHSSIFLFTRPDEAEARALGTNLIFQSFNDNEQVSQEAFDKVMGALAPNGALYINIQPNAHTTATFAEGMYFNMPKCEYDFDNHRVEKVFQIVVNGVAKRPMEDPSYVQKWQEFQASMSECGYIAEVSEDGYWVIVRNKQSVGENTDVNKKMANTSRETRTLWLKR